MRWFRKKAAQVAGPPLSEADRQREELVRQLALRHRDNGAGLIELLQAVSARYGFLPRDVMEALSQAIAVPLSRLYSLATFYHAFRLTAPGRHRVAVCTGTACHVRGAPALLDTLQRELGIQPGQTTPDGRVSLETVNCVGLCAVSPVLVADEQCHGRLTPATAVEAVKSL